MFAERGNLYLDVCMAHLIMLALKKKTQHPFLLLGKLCAHLQSV